MDCPRCGAHMLSEGIPNEGWCPNCGPVFIGKVIDIDTLSYRDRPKGYKPRRRSLAVFATGVTFMHRDLRGANGRRD